MFLPFITAQSDSGRVVPSSEPGVIQRASGVIRDPLEILPGDSTLQSGRIHRGVREYRLVVRRHTRDLPEGRVQHHVSSAQFAGARGVLIVQAVRRWKQRTLTMAFLERDSLRPIWARHHGPGATISADFESNMVQLSRMPNRGKGWLKVFETAAPAFDAFSLPWIVAALPLRLGYLARLPCFSLPRGRLDWVHVAVTGRELHPKTGRPTGSLLVDLTGEEQRYRYVISSRQRTIGLLEAIRRGERPWRLDRPRHLVDAALALDMPA